MGRSSVFSLEQIYRKQVVGTWSKIPEVFRYVNSLGGTPNVGYFGAGSYNPRSIVDRVDFDNDTATASPKGNMSSTRYRCSGIGNKDFGYFGSGTIPGTGDVTTVDRLDYANDTADMVAKGPLANIHRTNDSTVGNNDFGYWCGSVGRSYVSRVDYGNDTATAVEKGPLVMKRSNAYGVTSPAYGYICGGETPSRRSSIDRIDFNSDTSTATPKGNLSGVKDNGGATGNASYGYIGGGSTPSPVSTIDRIDFSNDTATAVTKGPLGRANWLFSATGNTSYGYWGGGYASPSNDGTSFVDRVDYSNDTATASPKGNLSVAYRNTNSFSPRENALSSTTPPVPATRTETHPASVGTNFGYFSGGQNSTIDRLDYSNDSAATSPKGKNTTSKKEQAAFSSLTHGYWAGGRPAPLISTVDRLDFSNDTANASPKGPLSSPAGAMGGAGTVNYGYVFGTYASPPTSTIQRVDFSNDTATAPALNTLSTAFGGKQSAGNQNYAWNAGGYAGSPLGNRTDVERLDYGSDTSSLSPKGNLSNPQFFGTQVSSGSYGYVCAGPNGNSRVDRIDYSNDTATASPKGPLSVNDPNGGGTSNTSYGYIALGGPRSTIDRIDFSNDTPTSSNRSTLTNSLTQINECHTSSRENNAPTTGPTSVTVDKGADGFTQDGFGPAFGYHIGGMTPSGGGTNTSTVERIDYSNDTATAAVKGPLSSTRHSCATVGTSSYGYACGGPSPSDTSTVDRVDYANDTAAMTVVGPLNTPSSYNSAVYGNASYGYIKATPSSNSSLSRIEYASDSSTATPKGNLTNTVYVISQGAGNNSYGYLAGGFPTNSINNRIDYSNDTATAVAKGNMSVARHALGATGNSSYGYFGGGTPGSKSTVDRLDYSSDTTAMAPKGPLSTGRYAVQASGSPSYGYFGAGNTGDGNDGSTIVDRIDYSNDTATAAVKGPLTAVRRYSMGVSAQGNGLTSTPTFIPRIKWVDSFAEGPDITQGPAYGYIGGGYNPSSAGQTTVLRIDYANDTATLSSHAEFAPNWVRAKYQHFAVSSMTHSYFGGGKNGGGAATSSIQRIDLANDTADTELKGNLSNIGFKLTATGNHSYGYIQFKDTTTVDRMDYSNDESTATPKGNLTYARNYAGATGTQSYGYWAGSSGPAKSTIERIDYSNDTATAARKGDLSGNRYFTSAAGNLDYGYVAAGAYGPATPDVSTVDRIDYSNDTATAATKGPLSAGKHYVGATSNLDYGYFSGGRTVPSATSTSMIERIDFSNDTATASPKGNMDNGKNSTGNTSARANGMPTANPPVAAPVQPPFPYPQQLPAPIPPGPAYGYYAGGGPGSVPSSLNQRIDYASDTSTALSKGKLTLETTSTGGVSSNSYGYIAGGDSGSDVSTVNRIDYSNDSANAVAKGPITVARAGLNGIHNLDYGYLAGGWLPSIPGPISTIDRIDFASDSATATPKGNAAYIVNNTSPIGNLSYGYLAGGYSNPNRESNIQRIDYSSDTSTTSPKGQLSFARSHGGNGAGNSNYGYVVAGFPSGSNNSTFDRIDYANDTATAVQKGPYFKSSSNWYMAGVGNSSYGYWSGDEGNVSNSSTVGRLDYSNDTATAPRVGDLMNNFQRHSGVSARANGLPS